MVKGTRRKPSKNPPAPEVALVLHANQSVRTGYSNGYPSRQSW
jgi:hypothetical protein